MNILNNVYRYLKEYFYINIFIIEEYKCIFIIIEDEGEGILFEDFFYIFDCFYCVDKVRIWFIGGIGLGLFIVKEIVELYGGNIIVMSEVDYGFCFIILLLFIKKHDYY